MESGGIRVRYETSWTFGLVSLFLEFARECNVHEWLAIFLYRLWWVPGGVKIRDDLSMTPPHKPSPWRGASGNRLFGFQQSFDWGVTYILNDAWFPTSLFFLLLQFFLFSKQDLLVFSSLIPIASHPNKTQKHQVLAFAPQGFVFFSRGEVFMMDSQRSFLLRGFSPLEGLDVFLLTKNDGLMAFHTFDRKIFQIGSCNCSRLTGELGGGLKHCLFSPPSLGKDPIWLIFFKRVETTN